ncbi:YitT family protein [Streptococcus himalayensis]|nr:YitT family protein [Streptococcus himalayensis]
MRKEELKNTALVILGSILFGININLFVIPNEFGEGGITGLTLLLYYVFGWSVGLTSFIFNAVLLVLAYTFLDKKRVIYTLLSIVMMSLSLEGTKSLQGLYQVPYIAMFPAGILTGISLAMVLLGQGTTAGSDIIALLCEKYWGWKVAKVILAIDILVLLPLALKIGWLKTFYTLVMIVIISRTLDALLALAKKSNPTS